MNAPASFRPSRLQLRLVLERIFFRIIDEGDRLRDTDPDGFNRYAPPPGGPHTPVAANPAPHPSQWTDEDWEEFIEESARAATMPDILTAEWQSYAYWNLSEPAKAIADNALTDAGLTLSKKSDEYTAFLRDTTRVIAAAYAIEEQRWNGDFSQSELLPGFIARKYRDGEHEPAGRAIGAIRKREADFLSRSLEDAAREFMALRRQGGTCAKTARDDQTAIRYFLDLVGNMAMGEIERHHVEKFRQEMSRVPVTIGKGIYRNLTPSQAIKAADRLEEEIQRAPRDAHTIEWENKRILRADAQKKTDRMRMKTTNKHLSFFTGLWRSSVVPESLRAHNPFSGTLFRKKLISNETARRGTRRAFTQDELYELFHSPAWQGYQSEAVRTAPGKALVKDWHYWCPLLALYAGLRREELAALSASDFEEIDDIWVVNIRPKNGTRVKSMAAIRQVPIHSKLLQLGFRQYVHAAGPRAQIFQGLRRTGTYLEYGEQLGKWFRYYRKQLGIYYPGTSFHSFRHNFIQALRNKGIGTDSIALLVGHEDLGVTAAVYGANVSMRQKKETVEQLNFKLPL
ncbi:site-specific integrase [Parvibaculum sp.]|uniref:site-specific integrase n=1 Tax=Parvibaculum sp. TaxID=2024848 RepID=UPI001D50E583|nr:site-specific integrase [Parvibaculum sp.]MBX3491012.1 site-specific integrase [Parvibaculum sp.]